MKILSYAFKGALIGVIFAVVCMGILAFSMRGISYIDEVLLLIGLIFVILLGAIGAISGIFLGISNIKAEKTRQDAENKKNAGIWASEVKQKALNVNNTCSKNKTSDKPLVSATYEANAQMTEIMNELTKVAEKQGKVDSLAEELSKKGGASI